MRSVSRPLIEAQFLEQVLNDLNSPDLALAMLAGTKASLASDTDPAEIRKVAAAVSELSERIIKTLDMAAQLSDPAPALRKIEALEQERAEKALRLQVLEAEVERASWIH